MAGPLRTYAFVNAKLRARISKILPEETLRKMARAPSLPECVQVLNNTDFAVASDAYNATGDVKMAELALFEKEVKLYLELEKYLTGKEQAFVQALATRFEIDTITNALRLWFDAHIRGRSIEGAAGYLYREPIHCHYDIDAVIHAETLEVAAAAFSHTPYAEILLREASQVYNNASLFQLEVAFDNYFFRRLLDATESLKPKDRTVAKRLIGVEIDLQNINWLVRLKGFYDLPASDALRCVVPWGLNFPPAEIQKAYDSGEGDQVVNSLVSKSYPQLSPLLTQAGNQSGNERLAMLERILQEVMLLEVKRAMAGNPFTIGIVLAYFILKQNETRKVITILNAKSYDWPEEAIMAVL